AAVALRFAQGAQRKLRGLLQQRGAVARHRKRMGARPRLVGDARRGAGREAHRERGAGQRLARRDLVRAVGLQAPHAEVRDALERRLVQLAERERHVEVEREQVVERRFQQAAMRQLVHQIERFAAIGAERPLVQTAIGLEQERRRVRRPARDAERDDLRAVGARDLRERLRDPARLQARAGEHPHAQLARLRCESRRSCGARISYLSYKRQTRSPSRRMACASSTDFTSITQPPRTILRCSSASGISRYFLCETARISASAAGSSSHERSLTPYSCSASSALAIGSCTCTSTPNSRSSARMSATLELRMSGQFSLKVRPSTLTRAPLMLRPAWIICWIALRAMCAPMPSLMRRPARITCGW